MGTLQATTWWRRRGRGALAALTVASLAACSASRSGDDASPSSRSPGAAPAAGDALASAPDTPPDAAPTTAATTSTTSTTTTTTTTTIPLVTAGATVLVANAADVPGAAAKLTSELGALGFQMAEPTNADGLEERLEVSKVYYLAPGQAVAESIARVLGNVVVAPMPTPVSISGGPDQLGAATVVVMLGRDLAGADLPG